LAFTCAPLIFNWIGNDLITGNAGQLTIAATFAPILFGLGAINLAQNPDGLLALVGHQRRERRVARERRARIEATAEELGVEATAPRVEPATALPPFATAGERTGNGAEGARVPDAALSIRAVFAGYGEFDVLHGVSVDVPAGSVVALLGANGAGKSTLCNVAAGIIAPTQGEVLLEGNDIATLPAHQRFHRGVLVVPEARGIFPDLSVEENLRILLRSEEDRKKAYDRF